VSDVGREVSSFGTLCAWFSSVEVFHVCIVNARVEMAHLERVEKDISNDDLYVPLKISFEIHRRDEVEGLDCGQGSSRLRCTRFEMYYQLRIHSLSLLESTFFHNLHTSSRLFSVRVSCFHGSNLLIL
jgi:hypothetical protein